MPDMALTATSPAIVLNSSPATSIDNATLCLFFLANQPIIDSMSGYSTLALHNARQYIRSQHVIYHKALLWNAIDLIVNGHHRSMGQRQRGRRLKRLQYAPHDSTTTLLTSTLVPKWFRSHSLRITKAKVKWMVASVPFELPHDDVKSYVTQSSSPLTPRIQRYNVTYNRTKTNPQDKIDATARSSNGLLRWLERTFLMYTLMRVCMMSMSRRSSARRQIASRFRSTFCQAPYYQCRGYSIRAPAKNLIQNEFFLQAWKKFLESMKSSQMQTANREVGNIEGLIPLFNGMDDQCVRARIRIIKNLAVNVLLGSLIIVQCLCGIFRTECKIVPSLSKPMETISTKAGTNLVKAVDTIFVVSANSRDDASSDKFNLYRVAR